ncbi:ABC transporter permease [Flavimaricola marinus]|uniref:Ribose transport system permease protein RbsC n=1 Tax=Flavimaricola marinus TaxID=1819565 RepID=A0A238LK35_9RHOB|nr:ABC transporter permease [Flavimaricola marinus]SMY09754.1 Ribose transport system permease protein RbsC [Flavimaricola marinus]
MPLSANPALPQNMLSRTLRKVAGQSEIALFVSLVLIVIVFSSLSEYFLTTRNLTNVLGQASIILLIATGVAVALIGGEVDISVGSLVAAVALPLVEIMNATGSLSLGILGALVLGLMIGAINGYLSAYLRINSLIVTLGMLFLIRGGVYLWTNKRAQADTAYLDSFFAIGNGKAFGIMPIPAIIAGVIVLMVMFIMHKTRFGRRIYAAGGSAEVARMVGYDVRRIKFICFLISSTLATIAGILLASRLGAAVHTSGQGYEFQAIAAVVLGGVSLAGGRGNILGAALGVLILAYLSNGLGMINAPTEWQLVITGIVIVAAVSLDSYKKSKE